MKSGRIVALIVSLTGGVAASQAPELAQQYRQRLEGARQELARVVADFDADAARSNLDRGEALRLYERSDQPFLNDRAHSIRRVMARADHLERQSARLAELPPALRPLVMIVDPDGDVLSGAVGDFEPAVPLTPHGLIWSGAGLLLGFGLFRLAVFPFRHRRRAAGRVSSN